VVAVSEETIAAEAETGEVSEEARVADLEATTEVASEVETEVASEVEHQEDVANEVLRIN